MFALVLAAVVAPCCGSTAKIDRKSTQAANAVANAVACSKFDPLACSEWNASSSTGASLLGGQRLRVPFSMAFSVGEKLANFATGKSLDTPKPEYELRVTNLAFAEMLEKRSSSRKVCQDVKQTKAIILDVISPARLAPGGICYSKEASEQGSLPFIPVRWLVGTRGNRGATTRTMTASARHSCPLGGTYEMMTTTKCSVQELDLLDKVLEEATGKVDEAAQRRFAASELGLHGKFKLGYLPILPPADADMKLDDGTALPDPELAGQGVSQAHWPTMPCHSQACQQTAKMRCGDCKGAYYCSAKCRRDDWKARHKAECTGAAATAARARRPVQVAEQPAQRPSVVMDLGNNDNEGMAHMLTWSHKTGAMQTAKSGVVPPSYHKDEFMIKVQVPVFGSGPLMVYDKKRTFMELVPSGSDAGLTLAPMIRTGGVNRNKGYFMAKREGDKIRVYTDKMQGPQAW